MADRCEVTILVDNYVDIFLPSTNMVRYPVPGKGSRLWAEQGLSIFVEVFEGKQTLKVLYDFGRSPEVMPHNMELLGVDPGQVDYLVLSHGHVDHFCNLAGMLEATPARAKLILHPEAYGRERFIRTGESSYAGPWIIEDGLIQAFARRTVSSTTPTDLGCGVHVSGQIGRTVSFEKGMPNAFVGTADGMVHDDIIDDQSIFVELDGCGIVILTGCCHAGIVNTVKAAQKMFPGQMIHAVVGGLHLNNASETQLAGTVEGLKKSGVQWLCAMHCTGYHAGRRLMDEFGKKWIPGTVGAKITFKAQGAGK